MSDLVRNPEDRFSQNEAQIIQREEFSILFFAYIHILLGIKMSSLMIDHFQFTDFQIASKELGIQQEMIYISDSNTKSAPNSTITAASMGTDIYAPAVMVKIMQIEFVIHSDAMSQYD